MSIKMANKIRRNMSFVKTNPNLLKIISGKLGTTNLLEKTTPRIEGIPNKSAVLKLTSFCFMYPKEPIKLVVPTTKRDKAVAVTAPILKIYTKTGTPKILPPPPIIPMTRPMMSAKKYPINSMCNISAKM